MEHYGACRAEVHRRRWPREKMIENGTLERWSAEYEKQRTSGAPGWAGADSYRLKQERISEALAEHKIKRKKDLHAQ